MTHVNRFGASSIQAIREALLDDDVFLEALSTALGGGGARTFGPYHIDYTDLPDDQDKVTLFTPDAEDVGSLIVVQWWPQIEGGVPWDQGSLVIGQAPVCDAGLTLLNGWGFVQYTADVFWDSVKAAANGDHFIAGASHFVMAVHIDSTDPVEVLFVNGGAPATMGSVDIFLLIDTSAGLYDA